ncbi:dihydrolipoamide acetyltransferase family protein [Actinotalea sp. Marseille-Q4924]|uniref:dihydrolipoamide acetyltransferase family protein n=1 Tax=Actinotalea sp. Marseille-Q4924 TaxID=2866571 RepID=UPI001CE46AFC|nr:dihydrolipoamide acetyltransferase family protein [Actinotalea sp. Marseille-Q4924]
MPRFEQFRLPDAGEGLTEAEVVLWHVAVGDRVEVNQPLVEIETAKSLVELPSPFEGLVTEILVQPGTTVDVGTPIITVDTDADGAPADDAAPAAAVGTTAPDAATTTATAQVDGGPVGGSTTADGGAETEGSGAVLVGYGVASHGTLRRRRGTDPAAADSTGTTGPTGTPSPAGSAPAAGAGRAAAASSSARVLAKPPVRRLAKDLGVDLSTVPASGPGGIVTREDVLSRAEANKGRELTDYPTDEPWLASGTVSPDGRSTRVPVRSVRRRTAEAMVSSAFTAPHVSVFHTVDVTRTMRLVAQLREDREFADVRVTPLLVAAKALLIAVRRHPEVNASWVDETQEIVYKHYVNLGIAAQTPRGLVVPNIKDAHRLSLHDLAVALAELTATARAGRTTPTDMSDGTITITNVGVFGIDTGTPILNPGESAILAVGAIREQPWVHKGKIKKRHVTQLALSFDHRLVDGGLGSRLLADVAAVLQDPAKGLVWG